MNPCQNQGRNKPMKSIRIAFYFPALLIAFLHANPLAAQTDKPEITVLNTFKLNIGNLAVTQIKLSLEREIAPKASLEFSAAYHYKNDMWYTAGYADEMTLGSGFGAGLAIRKFFDKKRYIFQPVFRSYVSFETEFRHTAYEDLWFAFAGADSSETECTRTSKKMNYYGFRVLFGLQKRAGRFVVDFYGGMGLRMITRNFNQTARNIHGEGCFITSTTEFVFDGQSGTSTDFSPSFHAGLKLGIRWGKAKVYKEKDATGM
jgi:hypothetical protein